MANKSTTGRSKKSPNSKKPAKQPIPIDSATSLKAENTLHTQGFPAPEDEIRQRAYEFYELRGCQHGFHHEDWLRAESEIAAKYNNPKGKSA